MYFPIWAPNNYEVSIMPLMYRWGNKGTRSPVIYPKSNGQGTLEPGFKPKSAWTQSLSSWLSLMECNYQVTVLPLCLMRCVHNKPRLVCTSDSSAQWDVQFYIQLSVCSSEFPFQATRPPAAPTAKIQYEVFKQEVESVCLESTAILFFKVHFIHSKRHRS